MRRLIFSALQKWIDDPGRKPFILRGARQVGKTWIVRELGNRFDTFVEVNFELYPEARKIFHRDLDAHRITRDLSLLLGKRIVPGEALLFFDEIQEEPKAIQALRYFYEMVPEQHVIAAGSLLDFELEKMGMPVGRVTSAYMHPLSFIEFLTAKGEGMLAESILGHDDTSAIIEPVHQKLLILLGEYMAVGGMPEVVVRWCTSSDLNACTSIQRSIVDTYRQDFNKYAQKYEIKYVEHLFKVIPMFLGKIFKFSKVPGTYRKRDLQPALKLLEKANIVHKVMHSAGQEMQLGAQVKPDLFKLIFLDIALAQCLLGLDATSWLLDTEANFVNKGEITEAFVGQELLAYSAYDQKPQLYFWQRQARGSSAEIDYLVQKGQQVIPVEVKSATPGRLRSLRLFQDSHPSSPYGMRISALNYVRDAKLRSIPLYAIAALAKESIDLQALE